MTCYKDTLNVQEVEPHQPMTRELEIIVIKISDKNFNSVLCFGCYRPPSQGYVLLSYLQDGIDMMITANQCENMMILGDLNPSE